MNENSKMEVIALEGGHLSKIMPSIESRADSPGGIALRSAVAAVPVLGSSVSVLIESRLSAIQRDRIDSLFKQLSELQQSIAEQNQASSYTESLLEYAALSTLKAQDNYRAKVIANILYYLSDDDPHEVVRRFLIELAATLTQYELALLLNYSNDREGDHTSAFRRLLMEMNSDGNSIEDVRKFSEARLSSYELLNASQDQPSLTPLGEKLLGVL